MGAYPRHARGLCARVRAWRRGVRQRLAYTLADRRAARSRRVAARLSTARRARGARSRERRQMQIMSLHLGVSPRSAPYRRRDSSSFAARRMATSISCSATLTNGADSARCHDGCARISTARARFQRFRRGRRWSVSIESGCTLAAACFRRAWTPLRPRGVRRIICRSLRRSTAITLDSRSCYDRSP